MGREGERMMKKLLTGMVNRSRYLLADQRWLRQRRAENNQPAKVYYDQHYTDWPVEPNLAVYDMRDGQELDDSPFAIMRYWLQVAPNMRHIIVVKAAERAKFEAVLHFWHLDQDQRIQLVPYLSQAHMQALLKAMYVLSNAMIFSDIFVKRAQQRFINTWHGTPLKKMGYAMPGGVMGSWNVIRMLMMTDYLVLPNAYTAEVFAHDYRLSGLYPGQIVVTGYPRNDSLVQALPTDQTKDLVQVLKIQPGERVILYAPTWSGDSTKVDGRAQELDTYYQALTTLAKLPKTHVFFRPHPYFKAQVDGDQRFAPYRLPDWVGTNEILGLTDVLITDYSSLFFDFLVTGRPIIFFDSKDDYQTMRGSYLVRTSLPGPYTRSIDQLRQLAAQTATWQAQYQSHYRDFQRRFVNHDDGQATKRVVETIEEPIPKVQHAQVRLLLNGEDLSQHAFTERDTDLVHQLAQNYDVSVVAYEHHLLDSWYGQQFFKGVDAIQAVSRLFINRDIAGQPLTLPLARLHGRRVVGGIRFDCLVIRQANFSRHQQVMMTTAQTIIMTTQKERAAWLSQLGLQRVKTYGRYEVWQVSDPEQPLAVINPLLKKLEEVEK